ncbi:Brp/Blh family beta-carotene 15,15'-dioxygenase [Porphyrobacter sp. YT40]|uniref:Brp/Blh family beta-carotene 15,15'-dioxygenase n=1 Tax=Porphyrobacter sp. YT40 TaxID=2547601 RepID=UPI0025734C5E|nr:Brp/Blh family beta-carotene 15,15'-dioxygenase [Porphyrobacter sp. YT40]
MFFAAGLAHGAALEDGRTLAAYTIPEAVAYVALAIGFAGLFIALPFAGLVAFLALSAWHFAAAGRPRGHHPQSAIALALVIIGGGALFWPDTTRDIFTRLTGAPIPSLFMTGLATLGAIGIVMAMAARLKHRRGSRAAIAAVLAGVLLHPVLAVGLSFLAFHALPETIRQLERFGPGPTFAAVLPTLVLAAIGGMIVAGLVFGGVISLPVAAALAVGMTVPHMLAGDLRP